MTNHTKTCFAALAVAVALPLSAMAQAQTTAPITPEQGQATNQNNAHGGMADAPRSTQATTEGPFITVPGQGAWRVSDLEGKSVYTTGGESIGEIGDVLVSQDGSVNAVIVGVGGFLGINQKDVAVDMSALQLGPGMTQDQGSKAADQTAAVSGETTASTNTPAAPAPGNSQISAGANPKTTPDTAKIGEDGLPKRIVLNVTREQLEQAPAFQGVTPAR